MRTQWFHYVMPNGTTDFGVAQLDDDGSCEFADGAYAAYDYLVGEDADDEDAVCPYMGFEREVCADLVINKNSGVSHGIAWRAIEWDENVPPIPSETPIQFIA